MAGNNGIRNSREPPVPEMHVCSTHLRHDRTKQRTTRLEIGLRKLPYLDRLARCRHDGRSDHGHAPSNVRLTCGGCRPGVGTTARARLNSVSGEPPRIRLDVWLDVACLFKTRSEAQKSCALGRVALNGQPA